MIVVVVIVVALPSPPTDVKVSDVTSTSVKLSWSHPNPDDIQYYTISHKPRSASQSPGVISGVVTMYYTIRPLSPYTQYEFTISAVNGFGHGPPSPPIVATTGETGKRVATVVFCFSRHPSAAAAVFSVVRNVAAVIVRFARERVFYYARTDGRRSAYTECYTRRRRSRSRPV